MNQPGPRVPHDHHRPTAAAAEPSGNKTSAAQPTDAAESDSVSATGAQPVSATQQQNAAAAASGGGTTAKWLLRTVVQAAVVLTVISLTFFLLGLAQRTGWLTAGGLTGGDSAATQAVAGEPKLYICPMMCTPPLTEPGRCPVCGMELVEATSGGGGDGISVMIDPVARRLVGIQTAEAKLGDIQRTIRTIGSIEFDESRLSTISAYIDGRLDELFANYVGVKVEAGDDLALIYSPQLFTAQAEYVSSLDSSGAIGRFQLDDSRLAAMARENLSELGMTDAQLAELTQSREPKSRIRIKSPQSGTVIEKAAVEGEYVKTGQMIFRIADLSSVWLMLDLFPEDAATVRFGQQVEAEVQSLPGEVFTGRIAFIDPTVNPKTRSVRVRVEILNFDGKLRPGDYATARVIVPAISREVVYDPALAGKYISPMHPQVIRDDPGECPLCGMALVPTSELGFSPEPLPRPAVVTVPRSAVLLAGGRSVVYVETEPGRFEIRQVTLGPMNSTEAIILGGLAAGESVATHGNFLIDSQMQLAGNPSLMDPTKAPTFAPGPLPLPIMKPAVLTADAGVQFDLVLDAYLEIHHKLAEDEAPGPLVVNALLDGLGQLERAAAVPDEAQRQFAVARRAALRMSGSLEAARSAYRSVSHALLRAASVAIGPRTAAGYHHMYCPMVPGGGGDWLQRDPALRNPYMGSAMPECGEVVARKSLGPEALP